MKDLRDVREAEEGTPAPAARRHFRIPPADEAGLGLHLRHAGPAAGSRATVLLVHGATIASGLWDIAVPGYSTLEALAARGFSAWALDVRGYGRSARLASPNRAYAGREEAVRDIGAAVDFALAHDGRTRLVLFGGSWGSITASIFATRRPHSLMGLALMAPLYATPNRGWIETLADPASAGRPDAVLNPALGATRAVDRAHLLHRWDPEIPPGHEARRHPEVLDALLHDALQAEPAGAHAFTVPNGTLHDLFEVFSGRPLYDPAAIALPTLLMRGEHDATSTHADAQRLFERLASRDKTYMQFGDAGHFVCAEVGAGRFQRALADFVDTLARRG